MKFSRFIEVRERILDYIKSQVPSWPDYVVQDMLYKGFKNNPNKVKDYLDRFAKWTGHDDINQIQWNLKTIPVKLELFDPNTKSILEDRMGGVEMAGADKDVERHKTQAGLLSAGPSKEPIIVASTPEGYALFEGFHRTIQSLKNWPEGYDQSAWIFSSNNSLDPRKF